jgi:hypothetical protein
LEEDKMSKLEGAGTGGGGQERGEFRLHSKRSKSEAP